MAALLTILVEMASVVLLFFSSVLFIIMLYSSSKDRKIPRFWMFFAGAFYLLTMQNAFSAYMPQEEPFGLLGSGLKLAASVLVLLGMNDIYQEFHPYPMDKA